MMALTGAACAGSGGGARTEERGLGVRVPESTTQLLVGITADWDATDATLRLWERDEARGAWRAVGEAWPAVVGRSGLAWGRGAHGDGPPAGQPGPRKHEGDGTSPAGLFAIGPSFGYADAPPAGARLPYTTATASWRCVDDPASRFYNRLLDERTVTIDWSSREELRRDDDAYRWIIEVRHNADGSPGAGSCIVLHVWSGAGSSTAGCTAMEAPRLEALLTRLDPAAAPMFVLLPRDVYAALAIAWQLPR
jgi:L,D-peptidoglycan transpeptidase YkuD (ErfK/YbiS/YcfS/YnhG family)